MISARRVVQIKDVCVLNAPPAPLPVVSLTNHGDSIDILRHEGIGAFAVGCSRFYLIVSLVMLIW